MHKIGRGTVRSLASFAMGGLICLAMSVAGAGGAMSQEIEPFEFTPAPAGTNLIIGYYIYGHDTEYNIAGKGGATIKNSGVEVNVGLARYVHFFDLGGHPAGIQILQPFGSESGAHVDGERLGSAFGAQNTILSAFFWPYANQANKTYLIVTGFIYPPDGTYDPHSAINLGDNRLDGDIQVGFAKGIGDHFAFDSEFDAEFYGSNNNAPVTGGTLNQNPTYRGQLWLNWSWSTAFTTSIGWEGLFGGRQTLDGTFNGSTAYEQRLRAAASLFLSPTFQTIIELNHDVAHSGNFKQDFGATLRLLKVF